MDSCYPGMAFGTGTLHYLEMTSGMSYGTVPPNSHDAAQYYIVEINNWTVEKPGAVGEKNHFVFQKDGNHTVVEPKEGEELGCSLSVKKVDAATKKDIIKQWKAFKK